MDRRVVVPMAIGRAPPFDFGVASTSAAAKRGIPDAGMFPSINAEKLHRRPRCQFLQGERLGPRHDGLEAACGNQVKAGRCPAVNRS
jgi:hypothetical protein